MYVKNGVLTDATKLFDEMLTKDTVSWNIMISGFLKDGNFDASFGFVKQMQSLGFYRLDQATLTTILSACDRPELGIVNKMVHCLAVLNGFQREISALREGCQIHGRLWKLGLQSDFCIESALMDMYSKCGSMGDALQIFESAVQLDEVSMTVILVGFAQNGFEEEARHFFVKMLEAGAEIDPNMVSAILGVFGVDTSLGLGQQIHSLVIKRSFGSNPFVGNGLINMYSKCGDLEDSIKVFTEQLILSAPEKPSPYILLANIYSSQDKMHPQAEIVYGVLAGLYWHMIDEGYVLDKRYILSYVNQD
ncbi:hypothetical protein OIU79_023476 [Salix purpurea]|uniref:Pentatricopeptide repeat-containing protein n=1 Tax=Salix purpurea TaxID=77065 RepID=A0A9Q0W9Y2_SALPP|nr:hypothetical protein OIU79_023476 [Salix purpurea]